MKNKKSESSTITRPVCPHCGKRFDNRGYSNHVNSCRGRSGSIVRDEDIEALMAQLDCDEIMAFKKQQGPS